MADWDDVKESDYGYIHRVSGPLVIAEKMSGAAMCFFFAASLIWLSLFPDRAVRVPPVVGTSLCASGT